MKKADNQSLTMHNIIEAIKNNFPEQTDQELISLLIEVKKNNNDSLKHISMNKLMSDIKNLINNAIIDKECGICLEKLQPSEVFLMECCKKKVCKKCIKDCQKTKRECPFCRKYTVLDEEFPALS